MPQKVTAFTQDAISLTAGEELMCGDSINIFSTLRREFGKWIVHLDRSGEKCECSPIILPQLTISRTLKYLFVCCSQQ